MKQVPYWGPTIKQLPVNLTVACRVPLAAWELIHTVVYEGENCNNYAAYIRSQRTKFCQPAFVYPWPKPRFRYTGRKLVQHKDPKTRFPVRDLRLPPRRNSGYSLLWDAELRGLVFSYQRFGIQYRPHLQRANSWLPSFSDTLTVPYSGVKQSKKNVSLPLKMKPIRCSETSATNYQPTLRNIPKNAKTSRLPTAAGSRMAQGAMCFSCTQTCGYFCKQIECVLCVQPITYCILKITEVKISIRVLRIDTLQSGR